jgi:delta-1-pyrroline-5-carboxylate synthetase
MPYMREFTESVPQVATSQLLVTAFDFTSPERRENIRHVITQLLALGIVPIINENDAVSANQG